MMDSRPKLAPKPKVLCIDNNPNSQRLVAQMLSSDFEVKTTPSGPKCIEALRAFTPNAILLDVDLPNFDSFSVCRLIRSEPEFTRTPILFLSQMGTNNKRFKGFQAGGDDYIQKPLDESLLKNKINQSLQRASDHKPSPKSIDDSHPELHESIQALHEYMLTLMNLESYDTVGELTLTTLDKMGLKGAVHWHFSGQTHSSIGPLSDLENVLLQQAKQTFPLDHSARYLWGSTNIGAIIHNMPSTRSDQYQTTRQMLVTLFNAADRTLHKLKARTKANHSTGTDYAKIQPQQSQAKQDNTKHVSAMQCVKLELALDALEDQSEQYLSNLSKTLQTCAADKNIDEHNRQLLHKLLNQCIQSRIAIYDHCLEAKTEFSLIKKSLESPTEKPTPA